MTQQSIPYLLMRGGTSRGPYFRREHLPEDQELLAQVLVAVIGSGHPLNIDGIGGGHAVTTKVAMLSTSEDGWIRYEFAQVSVEDKLVDFGPTCGNILTGVGPAALEMGLLDPQGESTDVRIRAMNTGAEVIATVQTPGGCVCYDGTTTIDGVPGSAAPVHLTFMGVVGSSTGAFLPTGRLRDEIDGVEVTCMDVAMPMVIARADALGVSGYESAAELDAEQAFYARMEALRRQAGYLMGMGDVAQSVVPKFGLLAPARHGGTFTARYCMPWKTHPTMAVTGGQCLASCFLTPGTVADGLGPRPEDSPAFVVIEHPSGALDVKVDYTCEPNFVLNSVGLVRTARKLASGHVYVPQTLRDRRSI